MASQRIAGAVQSVALALLSLGAISRVGYNLVPATSTTGTSSKALTSKRPLTVPTARAWLGVLGMEADALAASGVDGEAATVMLADLQAYLEENGEAFVASLDAHNAAKKQVDTDERTLRAGRTPDDAAAHASALSSAAADRNTRQAAMLTAASTHLTEDQIAHLATARASADREIPAPYRLVTRTDAQWVALREALTAERQAAEHSEEVPEPVQSLLADMRAETVTATALASTTTLIAGVREALQ